MKQTYCKRFKFKDNNDSNFALNKKCFNTETPFSPFTTGTHLIRQHHLPVFHVFEDVVGRVQGPDLRSLGPDECGQVYEPQAVAVTQQTLGPHVRHSSILLCPLLSQLYLLEWLIKKKN